MTKRNDIHSIKNFDPAAYTYQGTVALTLPKEVEYLMVECPEVAEHYRREWLADLDALKERVRDGGFVGNFVNKGTCDHCGAWFGYGAEYLHTNGEVIVVGHTCAANDFAYDSRAARDKARAVKLRATRVKTVRARIAANTFLTEHDLGDVFSEKTMKHDSRGGRILEEMYGKLVRWGSISDKQIAFAKKLANEILNPAPIVCGFCGDADHDHKTCPHRHPVPVTDERIEIVGIIRFTEWRENGYGGSLKAIIETVDGFKIWTTLPAAIQDAVDGYEYRGIAVRFMAKVERSDRDATFGFAKRPTKAEVIDAASVVFNPRFPEGPRDAELRAALSETR